MVRALAPSTIRQYLRRGLLLLLFGAAISFAAVACSDGNANSSSDPTASTTPTAGETPGEGGNGAAPSGTGTPADGDTPVSDDGTPTPDATSPSPDTPVSSTPGGGGSPPSTATVAPVDPGYPTVEELAPIESIDILVMESFPPQYAVQIVSGLPSGCAAFLRAEVVERSGTTIRIEVVNRMPAPHASIACTMIYGTHESNVMLGSDFESGETYTVEVNDKATEFTAQ